MDRSVLPDEWFSDLSAALELAAPDARIQRDQISYVVSISNERIRVMDPKTLLETLNQTATIGQQALIRAVQRANAIAYEQQFVNALSQALGGFVR